MSPRPHVIKLGGSLLELPDLLPRLELVLAEVPRPVLLVGGGRAADAVRDLDRQLGLGEEAAHWLAIRALALNARALAAVLGDAELVETPADCRAAWRRERTAVVEPDAWLRDEDARGVRTPHVWDFTSDSIAAHLARQLGGARLTLLKSALPAQPGSGAAALASAGFVDRCFPAVSAGLGAVEVINLRDPRRPRCSIRSGA